MAGKKRFGRKSAAQDNFLAPGIPTVTSATDVGTSMAFDDGAVDVAFSATGVYAATSYQVLSSGGQTATGTSSPIRVTGLLSNTSYTFQVKAINANGESAYSSASSSVTATTVPATPSAPSASTVSQQAQDSVSWSTPANGGKAITNYNWESNDSKSGNTASTSVTVSQEAGTTQQYRVRAQNANGYSNFSAYSSNVTTFSFTPFSVFGFSPFSVFGFSPFSVFGFSPVAFSVFGFSPVAPFSVFGFAPWDT
jgi:predicted phage tail protein